MRTNPNPTTWAVLTGSGASLHLEKLVTPHAAMVERAERLLAAVEGMTPGPWRWAGGLPVSISTAEPECMPVAEVDPRAGNWKANAAGIAALRNDAPDLIRSLLQALEAERGECEKLRVAYPTKKESV